jgi:hypothetical protein
VTNPAASRGHSLARVAGGVVEWAGVAGGGSVGLRG